MPPESAFAAQMASAGAPTPEQLEVGRKLGAEVARRLVAELRGMGLPAVRAAGQPPPRPDDIVLRGYFVSVDEGILLSRTFYAGHSFNASLSGAGVLPAQDGNAVFYTNRTTSDQVAGFMQGMRHELGRGMMRDALIQSFEAIRAQLGRG